MINEKIESFIIDNLKSKRIKFDQDDTLFKLYIGSETSLIEYYPSETNTIEIAFYTSEKHGRILYDNYIFYEPETVNINDIDNEIDELVSFTKDFVKSVSKIEQKINDIRAICDDIQIDMSEFISVNYDFD